MTTCSVRACGKPVKVKSTGECSRHYAQRRLYGEYHNRPTGVVAVPAYERVLAHVEQQGECLIYTGAPHTRRPTVTVRRGLVQAVYRVVYEALVGPIPDGFDLHHTCERPRCVFLGHLELLAHGEHTRRHRPRLGTGRKVAA